MDEQMAAWMKYANPGEAHGFLRRLEGSWEAKATFWMKPGDPPVESTGRTASKLILGGRFLQTTYDSDMMGQPFQGMAIDGYDNLNEKYVGIWMDTMGTMMMVFEGSVDRTGNVREMFAEYKNPMDGKMTKTKGVTTIVSDDEHRYEGWNSGPDGEFYKSMEVVYKRVR